VLLFPVALLPAFLGIAGPVYAVSAALLSGCFLLLAVKVLRRDDNKPARDMFGFSILYLFALFGLLILDRAPGLWPGMAATFEGGLQILGWR